MYETVVDLESGTYLVNSIIDMVDQKSTCIALLNVMKLDDRSDEFVNHLPSNLERQRLESAVAVKYFAEVHNE